MNKQSRLSFPTITLHWVVGILMIASMIIGIIVAEMDYTPARREVMELHKSIGVIVLFIAAIRILWRRKEGRYPPLGSMSPWHAKGVGLLHLILLVATVLMPISGLMISIGSGYPVNIFGMPFIAPGASSEFLKEAGYAVHDAGKYVLLVGITLHVVGSIKYQLVNKHPVLSRMLGKSVNS